MRLRQHSWRDGKGCLLFPWKVGFLRTVAGSVRDDKQQAGLRITALQSWREPAELTPCTDVRTEQQREGVGF